MIWFYFGAAGIAIIIYLYTSAEEQPEDYEDNWSDLIAEAREQGMTPEEVRVFLNSKKPRRRLG